MSKSHHTAETVLTENQNNAMSDDPKDGGRNSFKPGPDGVTPVEKAPEQDAQDQDRIEAFGKKGAASATESGNG